MNSCMDEALKKKDGELHPTVDDDGEVEGDRKRLRTEGAEVEARPPEEGEEACGPGNGVQQKLPE